MAVLNVEFKRTTAEKFSELIPDNGIFYLIDNGDDELQDLYIGEVKISNGQDLAAAIERIAKNEEDIEKINGTLEKLEGDEETEDSIRNIIRNYLEADEIHIKDEDHNYTATTVEGALAEIAESLSDALGAGKVTAEEVETSEYAKTYRFYQGVLDSDTDDEKAEKKIIDINLAKDMVLKSGKVKIVGADDEPYEGAKVGEKYIDFVIANATEDHIYLPVQDLVDVYKAGETAEIKLELSDDNIFTATIKKINATKIIYREYDPGYGEPGEPDYVPPTEEQNVSQKLTALTNYMGTIPSTSEATNVVAYVDEHTQGRVEGLSGTAEIATVEGGVVTIKHGLIETDGIVDNNEEDDIVLAKVATTGAAEDISIESTAFGEDTTDVESALDVVAQKLTWNQESETDIRVTRVDYAALDSTQLVDGQVIMAFDEDTDTFYFYVDAKNSEGMVIRRPYNGQEIEMTFAEYQALSDDMKNSGIKFLITDIAETIPDDLTTCVTTYETAETMADFVSGETEASFKGKVVKWLTDIKAKVFTNVLTTTDQVIANTENGYLVDGLVVKELANRQNITMSLSGTTLTITTE